MTDSSTDRMETSTLRPAIQWGLRCVVLLQSVGVAGRYFFSANESESTVFGVLYFEWDWPEPLAQSIDDFGTLTCLAAAIVVFLCGFAVDRSSRHTGESRGRNPACWVQALAAAVCSLWMLTLAVTQMLRGEAYAELSLGEHAVRFATPLALVCYAGCCAKLSARGSRFVVGLLTLAAAVTFAVHGYKAFQCYSPFVDLILLSDARCLAAGVSQSIAEQALIVIGVMDIMLAALLCLTRWRWVAGYMAFWGLVTASSRMTAFGSTAWPEVLIRTANWGTPLILVFCLVGVASRPDDVVSRASEQ